MSSNLPSAIKWRMRARAVSAFIPTAWAISRIPSGSPVDSSDRMVSSLFLCRARRVGLSESRRHAHPHPQAVHPRQDDLEVILVGDKPGCIQPRLDHCFRHHRRTGPLPFHLAVTLGETVISRQSGRKRYIMGKFVS